MNMYRVLLVIALLISSDLNASADASKPVSIDSRIKTFVYSPHGLFGRRKS